MNHIFSTVWNASLGQPVVVSELAHRRSLGATGATVKGSQVAAVQGRHRDFAGRPALRLTPMALALSALAVLPLPALGAPNLQIDTTLHNTYSSDATAPSTTGAHPTVDSVVIGSGAQVGVNLDGTGDTAVGAQSSATGAGSTAFGFQSNASGGSSVAIGGVAQAAGSFSTALGYAASVTSAAGNSVALGENSIANRANAVSVGAAGAAGFTRNITNVRAGTQGTDAVNVNQLSSVVTGLGGGAAINTTTGGVSLPSYTIGSNTYHNVGDALTALASSGGGNLLINGSNTYGTNANAPAGQTGQSVALGSGAAVDDGTGPTTADAGGRNTAIGYGAQATGVESATGAGDKGASTAVGTYAQATGHGAVAVGGDGTNDSSSFGARAQGTNSVAIGQVPLASGEDSIAIGHGAQATQTSSIAIGARNGVSGIGSGAVGGLNMVSGNDSYAFGASNTIANDNSFVLGNGVTTTQDNSVVLGNASTDRAVVAVPTATAGASPVGVVSVGSAGGERQIINVAAGQVGTSSTDAVNGSQLYGTANSVVAALGGTGGAVNTDGTITAPTFTVNGSGSYATVQDALNNLPAGGGGNLLITGNNTYSSNATVPPGSAQEGVAIGQGASMGSGTGNTAVGYNSTASGTTSSSSAFGSGATASGNGATALGVNTQAIPDNSTAVGASAQVQTGATDSVALGTKSIATRANVVSVGQASGGGAFTRGITNVTAGTQATDAVNVSQLQGVTTALGGGAGVDGTTGAVTAPSYTIGGNTYNNVGDALTNLDGTVTTNTGDITTLQANALLWNPALNGGAGAYDASHGGTNQKITNLAAGTVASGSTDAVNGGQLYDVQQIANNANQGWKLSANGGTGVGIAPGATVDVSPGSSGNITVTQDSTTGNLQIDTNPNLTATTVTTTGAITAGGTVNANGGLTVAGGQTVDMGNNVVGNVAAGAVNATSTDAVNGSQLYATNQNVDANTTQINTNTSNIATNTTNIANNTTQINTNTSNIATNTTNIANNTTNIANNTTKINTNTTQINTNTTQINTNTTNITNLQNSGVRYDNPATKDKVTLNPTGTQSTDGGATNGTTITNLHRGAVAANSSDAVNGSQLYSVVQALGGTVSSGGDIVPPNYKVYNGDGTTVNVHNVGDVINNINNKGIKYFHANSTLADSQATGANSVGIGPAAVASGADSIAMGNGAQATGAQSIAVGSGNVVSGANSGAFGDPNTVTGSGSYVVGNNNTVDANNAFAVGNNVTIGSGLDGAVALGDGSTVTAATPTASATIGGNTYSFAGGAPSPGSVVSVGSAGGERQVQNVAAGQLSATSTDAVNGSQLFATNQQVNLNTSQIGLNTSQIGLNTADIAVLSGKLHGLREFAARGIAASLAQPSIPYLRPGKQWVGVAIGTYGGAQAMGIGYAYRADEHLNFGAGVSSSINAGGFNSLDAIAARVQMGWSW